MSDKKNTGGIVKYTGDALKITAMPERFLYEPNLEGKKFKVEPLFADDKKTVPLREKIDPYLPDDTLKEAVELMQILERPILLRGEPGCGKTRVAQAYAYERYKDETETDENGKEKKVGYRRFYFEWHVKSTSRAQDGLYTFDHISRLRDANLRRDANNVKDETDADRMKYRKLGPLGQAFLASKPNKPAILLIDEIDKADIDFPNDLLLELDEMRFRIPETNEEIIPLQRPLIFITSNQERELPQAFLRRCLFHFIHFPDKCLLKKIMRANFPELKAKPDGSKLIEEAIGRFIKLRDELSINPTANKNVSTSELKDWMRILDHFFQKSPNPAEEIAELAKQFAMPDGKLPFHTALLKTENDLRSLKKFDQPKINDCPDDDES